MEEEAEINNNKEDAASYRYWVRETTADAAPLPQPMKLSSSNNSLPPSSALPGTWEVKLNDISSSSSSSIRLEPGRREASTSGLRTGLRSELITSVGSLDFSTATAQITEVSRCSGDAFLLTFRNKKRVGYTYELSLKIKGEWMIMEENKTVKGHIDIPKFSFGELDDLQMEVKLNDEKDLSQQEKLQIVENMKQFLHPVREKLLQFEQALKDR